MDTAYLPYVMRHLRRMIVRYCRSRGRLVTGGTPDMANFMKFAQRCGLTVKVIDDIIDRCTR